MLGRAWEGDWVKRVRDHVHERGFASVTAFAASRPRDPLIDLAEALGADDVAAAQVEAVLHAEAEESGSITRFAKDLLVRCLRGNLTNGWGNDVWKGSERTEFISALANAFGFWMFDFAERDRSAVEDIVWQRLRAMDIPNGWLPDDPDDPLLTKAFEGVMFPPRPPDEPSPIERLNRMMFGSPDDDDDSDDNDGDGDDQSDDAPHVAPLDLALREAISAHIEQHVGKITSVFQEVLSEVVHLDVNYVAPGPGRGEHLLITEGMSDRPMTVGPGEEDLRLAELVVRLPPEWPVRGEGADPWPMKWLKRTARYPHVCGTCLAAGDTAAEDPPQPLQEGLRFCGLLVVDCDDPPGLGRLKTQDGRTVHFYELRPLLPAEVRLAIDDREELRRRIERAGSVDWWNPSRPDLGEE